MSAHHRSILQMGIASLVLLASALGVPAAEPQDKAPAANTTQLAEPITKGQRVFTCGHSFHVWVPGIVADLCKKAGIP